MIQRRVGSLAAEAQRYASSMKPFLIILLTLAGSMASLAQSNRIGTFKFEKRQGTHKSLVIFHTRAFQPSKHRVTKTRNYQTIVDGRLVTEKRGITSACSGLG